MQHCSTLQKQQKCNNNNSNNNLTTLHQHPQDSQEKNAQDLIEGVLDYTSTYARKYV
jgi:hypothetical protein